MMYLQVKLLNIVHERSWADSSLVQIITVATTVIFDVIIF